MLPTFVIIGAMKGGTTSLFYYLDAHPEVRMASMRESDFFVARRNYGRGIEWYASLFDGPPGPKAFGESSPNYSKRQIFPGVPERMHAALPGARLIYCVRDPIDRIVSHWVHNVSQGRERRPFAEAVAADDNYVLTSRYHYQIQAYLERWDLDRILFVESRDLRKNRASVLREVFAFVGVDPAFESPAFDRLHHVSAAKTRPARMDRFIPSVRLRKAFQAWLPAAVAERIPIDVPEPDTATRARLEEALHPDAQALRALTGLPFPGWSV